MATSKIVHVVGTGTIGEPLTGLLVHFQEALGIDEVTFHKRTPLLTDRSKVVDLLRRGAVLSTDAPAFAGFRDIGIEPQYTHEQALERAAVVIDCTPDGNAMKESLYRRFESNTRGFIAQGSEFGFGKMYARGINDEALRVGEDRYIQVVSCNTHNISVLIKTLAHRLGEAPKNLLRGRFVCMRRANDISQDAGFIPGQEVSPHKDARFGTHHARDAFHLFQTLGVELEVFSSAIKLNSQYMHSMHFTLALKDRTSHEDLLKLITANDRVAVTHKKSTNYVFSFGRDHGFYGRILNQTVIPTATLHVSEDGHDVTGFCFTPQDGNSLLSSVAAALWFLDPTSYQDRLPCLRPYFFPEV